MIKNNFVLIPARAGSKRFPGKNYALLGGKPLISWTIEAAIESKCFSEIIVSTDDPNVIEIANNYVEIKVEKRKPELANDTATIADVLETLIKKRENIGYVDKVCAVLLPTVPFRNANHIRDVFNLLTELVDAVVSIKKYNIPPQFAFSLNNSDSLIKTYFEENPILKGKTRQQEQKTLYHPNGAIYLAWKDSFMKYKSFFNGTVKGYVMDEINSVDIDTKFELDYAKFIRFSNN